MAPSWFKRRIGRHFSTSTHSKTLLASVAAAQSHNIRQNPASLYYLPPELILRICWYLSLSEIATLLLVCRRFWNGRIEPGVFSSTWELLHLRLDNLDLAYARFYVLRMLEYDGLLARCRPAKYSCWGCKTAHEKKAFSLDELRKEPDLKFDSTHYKSSPAFRYCSPAKRLIWFGMCGEMTFAELKYLSTIPYTAADKRHPCLNGGTLPERVLASLIPKPIPSEQSPWVIPLPDISCFPLSSTFNRREMSINYTICLGRADEIPFFTMCEYFDLPLCPHVRLGDRQVTSLYGTNKIGTCGKCPTEFIIRIQQYVCISVTRYVGSLLSPTDPIWLSQSYLSSSRYLYFHCRSFSHWFVTNLFLPVDKRNIKQPFRHRMSVPEELFTDVRSYKPK